MKRTTCKEVKEAVRNYILESVDLSGYEIDESELTAEEKIAKVFEIFKSEKQWEIDKIGVYAAFDNWLKGLPSALSLAFYYDDERELVEKWLDEEDSSSYGDDKVDALYFRLIEREFFAMVRKTGAMV